MDTIFMRFLGLGIDHKLPDAKTNWLYKEQITKAGIIEKLFYCFDSYLKSSGFSAKKGHIYRRKYSQSTYPEKYS